MGYGWGRGGDGEWSVVDMNGPLFGPFFDFQLHFSVF